MREFVLIAEYEVINGLLNDLIEAALIESKAVLQK
jgi:hypothetical protein